MRPYQRTASGPIWNAIGSNCGWTSIGLLRMRRTAGRRGAASLPFALDSQRLQHSRERTGGGAGSPGETDPDAGRGIVELAPGDVRAAAPDALGHQGHAEAGAHEVHQGRHLDRLLADHGAATGRRVVAEDL